MEFNVNGNVSRDTLGDAVKDYDGKLEPENCQMNNDGTKTCKVWFPNNDKAKQAMDSANSEGMAAQGINGAAAVTTPTSPGNDEPGSSNTGVIVGVVIGVIVVVGVVAAVVVYRMRRKTRGGGEDDEDYTNMNMALEDVQPSDHVDL